MAHENYTLVEASLQTIPQIRFLENTVVLVIFFPITL